MTPLKLYKQQTGEGVVVYKSYFLKPWEKVWKSVGK